MEWTAWNNGTHSENGSGYGFKIPVPDRDAHFDRDRGTVSLELPDDHGFKTVVVNIDKDSFWIGTCRELISKDIGIWFIERGLAPWEKGNPPKFSVELRSPGHFRVEVPS